MQYRQTLKRYPRTLAAPIVICVILALWVVAGSPKSYESGVSLWVDHLPPAPSSLTESDTLVQTTPADQEMQIITELLTTRDFRAAVAEKGPLAAYLDSGPSKGWGPMALMSGFSSASPLDAEVLKALGPKNLTLEVTGPQVLHITLRAGTPAVAAGTANALVQEVNARLTAFAVERSKAAVSYSRAAVDSASKAVTDARDRLDAYRAANPSADSSDAHLVALLKAERTAGRELSQVTARFNQLSSAGSGSAAGTSFTVIDEARQPPGPVSGKKKLVMALFGGLFAGALISVLALIALTPSKPRQAPRPELWDMAEMQEFEDDFATGSHRP